MTTKIRVATTFTMLTVLFVLVTGKVQAAEPLKLDPNNPHYFIFRGHPTVLIGNSEHYGSVMNRDFNYILYLDTIKSAGFNVTRLFSGQYHERPGEFGFSFGPSHRPEFEIVNNSLAPTIHYIAPWARTNQPGALDGGNKFDLTKWDEDYFKRLKDFVQQASHRGIIVEMSLFSPYYVPFVGEHFWEVAPLNRRNNVNGIGNINPNDALSLKDSQLLAVEDAMVRKIVGALRGFDNVYYEICNEPWTVDVPQDWQAHIARVIADEEKQVSARHLIAQEYGINITSTSPTLQKIVDPVPLASIFPFHAPADAVPLNYAVDKPLGVNETGGGTSDAPYRIQAWRVLLSGGALFMGLDYSFTVGHEDGSFVLPPGQPGGGSPTLRKELGILHSFMNELNFVNMSPAPSVIKSGVPEGASGVVLADPGKVYAIYIDHQRPRAPGQRSSQIDSAPRQVTLTLDLALGDYVARWLNTKSGAVEKSGKITSDGHGTVLTSPSYSEDVALRISRANE